MIYRLLNHGSGETGIRTLGPREGSTVFETAPIDHSGISPVNLCKEHLASPCSVVHQVSAEREGFEPPEACTSTVFKTAAIDHSAISPLQKYDNSGISKKYLLACCFPYSPYH